jgi:hypothetical protein
MTTTIGSGTTGSSNSELLAKPLHGKTRLVVRGATNHYVPPFSRSILMTSRERGIKHIVVSTSMASQALRTYLGRFRQQNDATVEQLHPFQGDEDTLEGALTGKVRPTREQLTQALSNLATVLVRMHAAQGKILVLCQLGRNRSFTTAFCYYLCFQPQAIGRTLPLALADFKQWEGVSYDASLQQDGFQRLDETQPWLPWMQSLDRMFCDPQTHRVSRARIQGLLALAH